MIPQAYITAWRTQYPYPDDAMVEQDLILSRVLVELYQNESIAEQLIFRGGTALNKLYLPQPSRYSEDIDVVQFKAGPIGPVMKTIHDIIDPWLGTPKTKQGYGRVTLRYRFLTEIEPKSYRGIKIEINTREHESIQPLEKKHFAMMSPWYSGSARITVYSIEELLSTKLRALYQRKKGRDLFDLARSLSILKINSEEVVSCFLQYMEYQNLKVSRAQFEANLEEKQADVEFYEDITPLIVPGSEWNFETAIQLIYEKLVTIIPGQAWKGSSIP